MMDRADLASLRILLCRIASSLETIAKTLEQDSQLEKAQTKNIQAPSGPCSGAGAPKEETTKQIEVVSSTPAWCKAQGCQDPRGNSPAYCKVCPQFHNYDGTEVPDDEGWGLM